MPYITKQDKELLKDSKNASNVGHYNYLFSNAYLKAYIANPKYETIHAIRKASMQPQYVSEVKDIEDTLTVQQVTLLDRVVARDLAFKEFYDRIGRQHENLAKRKNGDLDLYKEAGEVLHQKALELVQEMQLKEESK